MSTRRMENSRNNNNNKNNNNNRNNNNNNNYYNREDVFNDEDNDDDVNNDGDDDEEEDDEHKYFYPTSTPLSENSHICRAIGIRLHTADERWRTLSEKLLPNLTSLENDIIARAKNSGEELLRRWFQTMGKAADLGALQKCLKMMDDFKDVAECLDELRKNERVIWVSLYLGSSKEKLGEESFRVKGKYPLKKYVSKWLLQHSVRKLSRSVFQYEFVDADFKWSDIAQSYVGQDVRIRLLAYLKEVGYDYDDYYDDMITNPSEEKTLVLRANTNNNNTNNNTNNDNNNNKQSENAASKTKSDIIKPNVTKKLINFSTSSSSSGNSSYYKNDKKTYSSNKNIFDSRLSTIDGSASTQLSGLSVRESSEDYDNNNPIYGFNYRRSNNNNNSPDQEKPFNRHDRPLPSTPSNNKNLNDLNDLGNCVSNAHCHFMNIILDDDEDDNNKSYSKL
ncbi:hypothetical protein HELRODRAFT_183202 [Helobdella robusta]|uniref:Death domain-containing protein n=1 Tax=Helobdella robusta TaxID=6412 RepID=T1FJA7_HELRO|nr:hypothetical protein HELRODRAFT_183202 [Helobdella robusta]ESO11416.1 hypothetical protein HELRODRAFT_183202 [Helobdella robusta]